MTEVFKYKAIGKGTLSRPYRFFKEGDTIVSTEELDNPALVPLDQYSVKTPKVLVPFMTINGVKQRPNYETPSPTLSQEQAQGKGIAPTPISQAYERSMDGVKSIEALLDNQLAANTTEPVDPEQDIKQGGAGTGSQNVI